MATMDISTPTHAHCIVPKTMRSGAGIIKHNEKGGEMSFVNSKQCQQDKQPNNAKEGNKIRTMIPEIFMKAVTSMIYYFLLLFILLPIMG